MRHRYIIVGIRKDLKLEFQHPDPTTKENPLTCRDALHTPEIPATATHHEIRQLQSQVQERLSFIKPGENAWSEDIPERLRLNEGVQDCQTSTGACTQTFRPTPSPVQVEGVRMATTGLKTGHSLIEKQQEFKHSLTIMNLLAVRQA